MLAILSPLAEECKTIRTYLEADATIHLRPSMIWRGKIGAHDLILAQTGIGTRAMQKAAEFCATKLGGSPMLLLGFGGATMPNAHVGDIVIGSSIVDETTGKAWQASSQLCNEAMEVAKTAELPCTEGRVVTVNAVVSSPHEKAFLGTKHQAAAVDMEGSALAEVATNHNVPWLAVRAIVDTMEMPLPEGFGTIREDGSVSVANVLCNVARAPSIVRHLPRLQFAAAKARASLTTLAKAWIAGH